MFKQQLFHNRYVITIIVIVIKNWIYVYYKKYIIELQAVAVEAGGTAAQPMEQAGITDDVIQKLQERATVLTQERKRRGRSVPEDLLPQDSIRAFQTLASHPV